jgi:hypothetical protein
MCKLHFFELVLADKAARVLARCARLAAETGGERSEAPRQGFGGEDLVACQIGEAHFRGRDQPAAIGRLELVIAELGQLRGSEHGFLADQKRRRHFRPARSHMPVQHELAKRPVQPRQAPFQHGKTASRHPHRGLRVEAQPGCQRIMFNAKGPHLAPALLLHIPRLVLPVGNIIGGKVRKRCQQAGKPGLDSARGVLVRGYPILERCDFSLQRVCLRHVAPGHCHSDCS